MTRRLCLLLAAALAPIALLSGCGGSGVSKKLGASEATIQTIKKNQASAYTQCVQATKNPGLPQVEKVILQSECTSIQTGNTQALKAAGVKMCKVEAGFMPPAQRATFLPTCKSKVK